MITIVSLKNRVGIVKKCQIGGLSDSNFFFGFLTPLWHLNIKMAIVQFLVQIPLGLIAMLILDEMGLSFRSDTVFMSCMIAWFYITSYIFACFYNRVYLNSLLNRGWTPLEEKDKIALNNAGYAIS